MSSRKPGSFRSGFVLLCLIVLIGVLLMTPAPERVGAQSSQRTTPDLRNLSVIGKRPGATNLFEQSQKLFSRSDNFQQQDAKSRGPVTPDATQCLSGTLAATDPLFDHPENATATCNTLVSPSRRDHYLLNLGACTTFPTSVTITSNGSAGCAAVPGGASDTTISVYRKGGATAGTASGSGFDPTDICGTSTAPQRLVGFNDDISGANVLSSVTVSLGPGDFDVVVSGFSDSSGTEGRGAYNILVTAAAANCTLTLQPTAADGTVTGRIVDGNGGPVAGTVISLSGAQTRKTITDANGNYEFNDVESSGFYTVTPSRANYSFSPANRSFSQLGNKTDAAFSASTASGNPLNPLDTPEYFVRQQYLDFLGREPDESGFNFWSDQILSCNSDAACVEGKRINVSAAFFLSIEFQQTGYLVYRMYQAGYGDMPGAPVPIKLNEFRPDTAEIGNGVIVNRGGWEQQLEINKQGFASEFVQRARFTSAYPTTMMPDQFVDKLFANAGVIPSASDRMTAIDEFGPAISTIDVAARGRALRHVAEDSTLAQQEFNQAFVLMEYFGYVQRDANTGPDTDFTGYNYWLDKLNTFGGNYQNAEMVRAFLVSSEYRGRFPR